MKYLIKFNESKSKKYYSDFADSIKCLKYILEDEGFIVLYPLEDRIKETLPDYTEWMVIGSNSFDQIDHISKNIDYKEFTSRLKDECPFISIDVSATTEFDLHDTDKFGIYYKYIQVDCEVE